MTTNQGSLRDDAARTRAIMAHDQSLLVEAGAGSGKTAVMAGRVAMMLAEGIDAKSIAAVTFTELAASELLLRIREFVAELADGRIPPELRTALPQGLSVAQSAHLSASLSKVDEITCSTIHGFCQRLIKPYPVEADIDPGASVMDRNQADFAFREIVDNWLRERLSDADGGILAEMVLHDPNQTLALVHRIAAVFRSRRTLSAPPSSPLEPLLGEFLCSVDAFETFVRNADAVEDDTVVLADRFTELADEAGRVPVGTAEGLVRLLVTIPSRDLCKADGSFTGYRKKTKWIDATRRAGLGKADGERLNDLATGLHSACCEAWRTMLENVAARVLGDVIAEVRPVLLRFREYKRGSALLDFDDLIFSARDLLRDHDDVRTALASRFSHLLVDEFQDTDPLQSEILWRLCGDRPRDVNAEEWQRYALRPGSLFLVGDPKQAIYRFRGADVRTYVEARDALRVDGQDGVIAITTNFRSCAPILTYVNEQFEGILSSEGQPGFTALDHFHAVPEGTVCVAALDVAAADADGKATAEQRRDAEAEAVAAMCARIIGSRAVADRRSAGTRPCRPGDIALLAPTGSDLWRYEEALERHGVPVATQAGKGLFRRQEVQDLIAITRILSDRRDTLALGALLRGPLVGLTEEELLDIVWNLPRADNGPDDLPKLTLSIDPAQVANPLARAAIERLQSLQRRSESTTPHDLLSQAVDVLRVRPILLARHGGQAERALANVDLFLSLASAFAVRGLRAFAEMVTDAWDEEAKAVEGRPDAQEEAVALYTIHAAKGLEWPIVIPINTMTAIKSADSDVVDRLSDVFHCPVFGVKPDGYEAAREVEKAELGRERVRLWYVAATRARELLVLPRLDVEPTSSAWVALVNLALDGLPSLELEGLPPPTDIRPSRLVNEQTREVFAAEAELVTSARRRLSWLAPSRDEEEGGPVITEEAVDIWSASNDGEPDDTEDRVVQGSRERGLVIHKLLEEVLTGEVADDQPALEVRARRLIDEIARGPREGSAPPLDPQELARAIGRTLAMPEIVTLRPSLVPEFPLYSVAERDGEERIMVGIADAAAIGVNGRLETIIDWKSDVAPSAQVVDHYRAQVRAYLAMTGTESGLIVLVTTGQIISVTRPRQAIAA